MDFDGSSAIVTGGASGIGEGCARALHEAGAEVVIVDMNAELGAKVAGDLGATFAEADVADPEAVAKAVDAAAERAPLRALVNAAGLGPPARVVGRDGEPMALELFEFVIRVNLIGSFNVLRLAAAEMAKTEPLSEDGNRGAIVNLASVAAFDGQIGQSAYSASKGGIVGMTLPLARDLSSVGIRVNTVAPGLVDTPIFGTMTELKEKLGRDVLFPKRLAQVPELVEMIMALLKNDYMNGEVVRVDGGIRMPPRSG